MDGMVRIVIFSTTEHYATDLDFRSLMDRVFKSDAEIDATKNLDDQTHSFLPNLILTS
jgi:hypothetical protein